MSLRWLAFVSLISACATPGKLINGPALASFEATDARCSDVVIRRPALGSRWGEFLRVRVGDTASTIVGQAKLSVGGKVEKEKAFFVSGRELVFDARWTNEKVEVAAAVPKGAVLELAAGPDGGLGLVCFVELRRRAGRGGP